MVKCYFTVLIDEVQYAPTLFPYIKMNGTLYPIEIKKPAAIQHVKFKGFDMLNLLNMPIGHGGVLCSVTMPIALSKQVDAIPIGYI